MGKDKNKKKELLENAPKWVMDLNSINEVEFCKYFSESNPMICVNGKLFDTNGEIESEKLYSMINNEILPYTMTGVSKKVRSLAEALKLYCYKEDFPINEHKIHLLNGTLKTDGTFTCKKEFCRNRLNVNYIDDKGAYYPEKFLSFLYDLLDSNDIDTLQEFLGYCLIPSTRGQKMLFIIGNGGEGKSRIGIVLQQIFDGNMMTGNFQRIETDRFFRYNLQNKLLLMDDDMQLSAFASTGYIKNLITAEIPIDVEAKGEQSRQARIYTRFICLGNGSPKALYDKTEGFARRMIILTTKPKPPNRINDPFIADKFISEKDKIFRWMFDGLRRLIKNDFKFTISEKAKNNISEALKDNCNIIDMLKDESTVMFGSEYQVTGAELFSAYSIWCSENALTAMKRDTFISWLKSNQSKLKIKYDMNVIDDRGRRVRGFKGIKSLRKITANIGV